MKNLARALLLTSALVLPAVAQAQSITPTVNPTGTASASGTSRNTPGATAVGGVIEVVLTDYDTVARTPGVTDASGNTFTKIEGPIAGSDNNSHTWLFRAPVTHASAAAELVSTSGTGTYNSIVVIYLAPPTGYVLGGVDCHSNAAADTSPSAACTTTQANDVLIGGGGWNYSGAATGTTLLQNDSAVTGGASGYRQPAASGSQSIGFTGTGTGLTLAMLAEKVTPSALSVSLNPASFTPAACPMAAGAAVSQASALGGDGNAVTWALSGASADPSLAINSTSGAITSNGSSAVCGLSYTTVVTGSQQ